MDYHYMKRRDILKLPVAALVPLPVAAAPQLGPGLKDIEFALLGQPTVTVYDHLKYPLNFITISIIREAHDK